MSIACPGYYFFPMIAGYNLGIEFIRAHYCMTFYLFMFAFELPSALLCFIFRNNAAEEIRMRIPGKMYLKKVSLFLCHLFPFAVAVSFGKADLTYQQKYFILRTKWPECIEWIKAGNFEIYDYNLNPWLAVAGIGAVSMVLVVYTYCFYLSISTMRILQNFQKSMSAQTYQMHKTALLSLLMQLLLPGILIIIPLCIYMFVVVTEAIHLQGTNYKDYKLRKYIVFENQNSEFATNTQFMIASHSMCSCLVMIFSNPNYRKCLKTKIFSSFGYLLKDWRFTKKTKIS
ncbi:Protein CBG23846 [Caenorhabditis briggsae]|uniref:Protein CBG23846 n=1 Tax=Caenorhabditis briggsae TaxID=6238 RepID=A8WJF5_CAEBR|nr:Protein CBG23846 [Caenorhabditis briggsae]CAP20597.2 Protein CBG23846 [Caenorhabditis briggsae]